VEDRIARVAACVWSLLVCKLEGCGGQYSLPEWTSGIRGYISERLENLDRAAIGYTVFTHLLWDSVKYAVHRLYGPRGCSLLAVTVRSTAGVGVLTTHLYSLVDKGAALAGSRIDYARPAATARAILASCPARKP